jgi:hypothetical protein
MQLLVNRSKQYILYRLAVRYIIVTITIRDHIIQLKKVIPYRFFGAFYLSPFDTKLFRFRIVIIYNY